MSVAEKLTIIAENQQDVYDAGHEAGYTAGINKGKGENHVEFWTNYQQRGSRKDYTYAFSGLGWTFKTFLPLYDIVPTNAKGMFMNASDTTYPINDLKGILDRLGVRLSFENCNPATCYDYVFQGALIQRVGEIMVYPNTLGNMFNGASHVKYIEKIGTLNSSGLSIPSTAFSGCIMLSEIGAIEGKLARGVNFAPCPLSVDSMKKIISALEDYTGTADANKYSLKFSSSCWTRLEASGAAPDGNTWQEYVQSTLCWNI